MISQEQLESRFFQDPKKSVTKTIHKFTNRYARAVLNPIMPNEIQNIVLQYAAIDESLPTLTLQAQHNVVYCLFMFMLMQIVSWITFVMSVVLRIIEIFLVVICRFSDDKFRSCTNFIINKVFQNSRSSFVPIVLQYQVRYASMSVYFVDHWCPSAAYFASLGFSETSVLIANICLFVLGCILFFP